MGVISPVRNAEKLHSLLTTAPTGVRCGNAIDCKVDNNCPLRWTNESARLWENEETPIASSQSIKVIMGSDVEAELFNKWK